MPSSRPEAIVTSSKMEVSIFEDFFCFSNFRFSTSGADFHLLLLVVLVLDFVLDVKNLKYLLIKIYETSKSHDEPEFYCL